MKLPVMIGALLCAGALAAYEDLGPLAEARKQYPGIFEAGSVSTLTVKGTPCYVFQGEAEQLFSGEFAEAAGELYEEATLTAKSNFYKHFTRPGESLSITMSGCSVLYQFNNKKINDLREEISVLNYNRKVAGQPFIEIKDTDNKFLTKMVRNITEIKDLMKELKIEYKTINTNTKLKINEYQQKKGIEEVTTIGLTYQQRVIILKKLYVESRKRPTNRNKS